MKADLVAESDIWLIGKVSKRSKEKRTFQHLIDPKDGRDDGLAPTFRLV